MAMAHRDIAGLLKRHGYSEVRKIGEGSFGKALLVQTEDGSRLVCKMVDVSQASQKETQDAVKEGRLLASFKHPYVVRYRESFIENGWLCILMDYCEGGDLTRQIETAKKKGHRIPEEQILKWITQSMLALKYIHEKHVLHRDLKSGNFFLSKSGNLKMGDFGIARVLSCTAACAKTQIGTPYYLSPEVCQEKPYTWPSDMWAMGCIVYELCALKVPFDAPNIAGLVQRICRGPTPTIPGSYSQFLRDLCTEMLNRNPQSRPSAENILQRPQIQAIVKQMLEEAKQASLSEVAGAAPPEAAPAPLPGVHGAGHDAGSGLYRKGDQVEYWSSTHKDWLPATVISTDADGRLIIDLKPNTWMNRDQQAANIRPRSSHAGAAAPPGPLAAACERVLHAPLRQRSPSVPGLRVPSPAGRPLFDRGPGSNVGSAVGSAVGSRCNTPSRVGRAVARSRDPSPAGVGSRAGTPSRAGSNSRPGSPRGKGVPPGMPRIPGQGYSPGIGGGLRPSRAVNAAGMAIAGGAM